ncbi:MAG: wax ester/triacylglycerol synthase family O-acyltransferase [Myxococcales bacterium]|nr:wax ester/triacylglycerol synthase family O-acyltransferase [Myxococcales bacterium]
MSSYQRLSALDRSFLDLEDHAMHMHVASVCLFDAEPLQNKHGGVDIKRIRDFIEPRLSWIPRYRQRIEHVPIEGAPVWVDDEQFNLNYHLRHAALPAPGSLRQLKRMCGRLVSQRLDRGKPLWEMWVIEGIEGGVFALVSKVHHCMIDGVSGAELMQVLLSPTPALPPTPKVDPWMPASPPGADELIRDAVVEHSQRPAALWRALRDAVRDPQAVADKLGDTLPVLRDTLSHWSKTASPTPLNTKIGPHRRFDWHAHELRRIKAVKNKLGGTVNDVVLNIVAGALRRFFAGRGVSPERLAELNYRIYCPVSVRAKGQRGSLGNQVVMIIVDLPIGEADVAARQAIISASTSEQKDEKGLLGAKLLVEVGEWTPATLITVAARIGYGNRANLVVTNVPGPQVPLYLLGARMTETYPLVPLYQNHALGIALFSYAGKIYWGFNADWDVVPDLHDFVVHVDEAFEELCAAAGVAAAD